MRHRLLIAATIGFGLMALSVALGCLYSMELGIRASVLEIELRGQSLAESEQDALLAAFHTPAWFWTAFATGTTGVGLLGVGGMLALLDMVAMATGKRGARGVSSPEGIQLRDI